MGFGQPVCTGLLVAKLPLVADVVGNGRVHQWRAGLGCLAGIRHHRQRLVLHLNQIQRVACNVAGFRHHSCHPVAYMPHAVRRQRMAVRRLLVGHGPAHGQWPAAAFNQVFAGVYAKHTGQRQRARGVDAFNNGMRMRAALYSQMRHARQLQVAGIGSLSAQKARVFNTFDGCADGLSHFELLMPS